MSTLTKNTHIDLNEIRLFEEAMLRDVMSPSELQRTLQRARSAITPEIMRRMASMAMVSFIPSTCCVSGDAYDAIVPLDDAGIYPLNSAPGTELRRVDELRVARDGVTVKWADLTQLPGFGFPSIRALGNQIFKHFAIKPSSAVKVIASFEDRPLLNDVLTLNSVLHFLDNNTVKLSSDNMVMHFEGTIDGYSPEIRLYHTDTHAYLVVLENDETGGIGGRYIYAFERDTRAIIEQSGAEI